jgi:simple sugar transport system ATP-binding protein
MVRALQKASFSLAAGSCHALLGENGAGKSTLMHVAYGMLRPDSGTIRCSGTPGKFRSPREARAMGIGMVHQHFTSVPVFTVAENVALTAGWKPSPRVLADRIGDLMKRNGLVLDPKRRAEDLTVVEKQRLEILKALAGDARVLLLDEPTGVLSGPEIEELFAVIRRFIGGGGSVVLITHKLEEALRLADTVTVLRQGATVFTGPVSGLSQAFLARAMIGPDSGSLGGGTMPRTGLGDIVLRCEGLEVPSDRSANPAVRGATLSLRAGEIVSIAAIQGNGQRELLRALAGLVSPSSGVLEIRGAIAFVPEDRTIEGLIPALSLTENVVLGRGAAAPWIHGPWIDWRQAAERTAALIGRLNIRAPGPATPAAQLSGGNQQKVLIARALESRPAVIIAEQPTRGLDLRATARVHALLHDSAAEGTAVLIYSSDLDEVYKVGQRRFAMHDGILLEAPPDADRTTLGALMLGRRE